LNVREEYVERVVAKEMAEIERRLRLLCGKRAEPEVRGGTLILVDDGLATGVTARAAIRAVRFRVPQRLVLAVPVCALQTMDTIRAEVDELVCIKAPSDLMAIGFWYRNFEQVPDEEVIKLLKEARCATVE
jgi:putative phosphoribosyl transferase